MSEADSPSNDETDAGSEPMNRLRRENPRQASATRQSAALTPSLTMKERVLSEICSSYEAVETSPSSPPLMSRARG